VAAYGRHLEAITRLPQAPTSADDKKAVHLLMEELDRAMAELEDLVFEVDVHAQHPLVGDVLRQLLRGGQASRETLEGASWDETRKQASLMSPLIGRLRDVCRWDLGLYAPDPYEDSNRVPELTSEENVVEQKRRRPSHNELRRSE
jgi:hypothetical protein